MTREGKRPRKTFSNSDKSKRDFKSKSFKKSDEDSEGKRPYIKRGEDKTSGSFGRSKGDGEKRTYEKRQNGGFRSKSDSNKSFGNREKKSFVKREDGKYESAERKPYREREKSPYSSNRKSFVKRADGKYESNDRKPFGDRDKKTFTKREGGKYESAEKKPYNEREKKSFPSVRKSFIKRDDGKYESSDRRSFGDKVNKSYSDRKPFERKNDDKKFPSRNPSPSEKIIEKSKKTGPKKTSTQKNVSEDAIRLNRYIANSGVCSRREADVLIATGVVTVNGKIITEMGYKVNPGDLISYGGVPIKNETKKYLILNKPKDYITTMDDPRERRTVMELIKNACKERLYPVGRLDRNTTGILLFTNDGDLTAKLTHPKFLVRKVYHVVLNRKITTEDFKQISEGFDLADGFIKPDAIEYVGDKSELGVEIHSGRNRIVRRMFEHLGYEVVRLDRVVFAGLTKKDLPRGKFRFLTEKEISFLKMLG